MFFHFLFYELLGRIRAIVSIARLKKIKLIIWAIDRYYSLEQLSYFYNIKEDEFVKQLQKEYKAKIDIDDDKLFMRIFRDYEKNHLILESMFFAKVNIFVPEPGFNFLL